MADDVRFWEAGAAARPDAPQAQLRRVLDLLEDPEPPWATIDGILHERVDGTEAWKRWQRCLTALHTRAAKATAALRKASHLLPDDPAVAAMRADGWEPAVELAARLTRMWGPLLRLEERPGQTRMTWERQHEGGRQAGQNVRCFVDMHPNNPGWQRVRWASWREGMRAPKAERGLGAALGVDAGEVFGGAPVPGARGGPVSASQAVAEVLADRDMKPANATEGA